MATEEQIITQLDEIMQSYKLSDVEEIIIEDAVIESISEELKEKLEQLKHLQSLQLINCQLKNLDNLPKLELVRLVLDNNELSGSDLHKLVIYNRLISLSIMGNQIDNLEDMKMLNRLPSLLQFNTFKNPVQNMQYYRSKVFEWLPKLILLDNLYQDGNEIYIEDDQKAQSALGQKGYNQQYDKKQRQRNPSDDEEVFDDQNDSDIQFGRGKRVKKVKKY